MRKIIKILAKWLFTADCGELNHVRLTDKAKLLLKKNKRHNYLKGDYGKAKSALQIENVKTK